MTLMHMGAKLKWPFLHCVIVLHLPLGPGFVDAIMQKFLREDSAGDLLT
jgi:hypothetical protein